jgi:MraZ protein
MFSGEFYRTIDTKGRLFIPTKLRDNLQAGIAIISKSFDRKCLYLFSKESWDDLNTKVSGMPMTNEHTVKFTRWFFSSVNEENIDQQGRVKIQQNLIEFASLKKEVVLIGVSNRAEIWAKEVWENYYKEADEEFAGNEEAIKDLGL